MLASFPAAYFIAMLGTKFECKYFSDIDSLTADIIRLFVAWIAEQNKGQDYRVYVEMIKKAVAPILAENQALIQKLQEKDEEIEKLEKSENVLKWVAIGSSVIVGIGFVYIIADNIH